MKVQINIIPFSEPLVGNEFFNINEGFRIKTSYIHFWPLMNTLCDNYGEADLKQDFLFCREGVWAIVKKDPTHLVIIVNSAQLVSKVVEIIQWHCKINTKIQNESNENV